MPNNKSLRIVGAVVTHISNDGSVVVHVPSLREDLRLRLMTERVLVKNQFIKINISDDERTCRLA